MTIRNAYVLVDMYQVCMISHICLFACPAIFSTIVMVFNLYVIFSESYRILQCVFNESSSFLQVRLQQEKNL